MSTTIKRIKKILFENQNVRQTIAKNTFWLSLSEVAGRLLRSGVVIYAARELGAAGFGVFSYALSLSALITVFSDMGLSSVLTRELSKRPEVGHSYFSSSFAIRVALTALGVIAIILGTPLITKIPLSSQLLWLIAFVFVFDSLRGLGTSLARATEKMEWEAILNILTQSAVLIAGLILLTKFKTPESLALAYVIGSGVGFVSVVYFFRNYFFKIIHDFDKSLVKPLLAAAWPFSIAGMLGAIMINTDTVMIGWFSDAVQLGYYSAAQKPILLLYVVPGFIAAGIFPILARLANNDNTKFRAIFETGLQATFAFALPITAWLFLMSDQIIRVLYGNEYASAISTLRVLSFTILLTFPVSVVANSIFAYNKQFELIIFGTVGAVSNAVLDIIFIPILGIVGSAWSTLITQAVVAIIMWVRMKKINYFSVLYAIRKMLAATLGMVGAIFIMQAIGTEFFLATALSFLTYFIILIILKENLIKELKKILETA